MSSDEKQRRIAELEAELAELKREDPVPQDLPPEDPVAKYERKERLETPVSLRLPGQTSSMEFPRLLLQKLPHLQAICSPIGETYSTTYEGKGFKNLKTLFNWVLSPYDSEGPCFSFRWSDDFDFVQRCVLSQQLGVPGNSLLSDLNEKEMLRLYRFVLKDSGDFKLQGNGVMVNLLAEYVRFQKGYRIGWKHYCECCCTECGCCGDSCCCISTTMPYHLEIVGLGEPIQIPVIRQLTEFPFVGKCQGGDAPLQGLLTRYQQQTDYLLLPSQVSHLIWNHYHPDQPWGISTSQQKMK